MWHKDTSTFVSPCFPWQAWHKETSTLSPTLVLRGRRGTYGTAWRAWSPLVACDAAALCVAGVALGFTWQAWHNLTSTFVMRAGVALNALRGALGRRWSPVTPRHFAWQAWHLVTSTFALRGMRGTYGTAWRAWWHKETSTLSPPWFCVAGVAFYGTAWHTWSPLVACDAAALCVQAWHLVTSTFVLRGKRVTRRHPPCLHLGSAWQAWHKGGSTLSPPWFCVAGVALLALRGALVAVGRRWSPVTPRHFAWQAWHLVSRGRRGTISHLPS